MRRSRCGGRTSFLHQGGRAHIAGPKIPTSLTISGTFGFRPTYYSVGLGRPGQVKMKATLRLGLIAALLPLLAGSASAKGSGLDHAILDGPGMDGPVRIEKHFPYLLDDAIFTHLYGSYSNEDAGRSEPHRSFLGPQFQLTYVMSSGKRVEVNFYPFAEGRPVAYAGPGQSVPVRTDSGEQRKVPVTSGWFDYKPGIVDLLQEDGLPTPQKITSETRSTEVWPMLLAGVLLVIALGSWYHLQR